MSAKLKRIEDLEKRVEALEKTVRDLKAMLGVGPGIADESYRKRMRPAVILPLGSND